MGKIKKIIKNVINVIIIVGFLLLCSIVLSNTIGESLFNR